MVEDEQGGRREAVRSLAAALAGPEVLLSAIEGFVVVFSLVSFFPSFREHPELLAALGLGLVIWCGLFSMGLRPLIRAGSGNDSSLVYRRAQRLPGWALLWRLVLWAVIGLGGASYLVWRGALSTARIFTVMTICLLYSQAISPIRWAVQMRVLRKFLARRKLEPPWLELQRITLFHRLIEIALIIGAIAAAFSLPFVVLFVPITLEQYMHLSTYFPWIAVVLGGIWYLFVVPRLVAPILTYLTLASQGGSPSREVLHRACYAGHRLPFRLALAKFGFFTATGLLLCLEAVTFYDLSLAQAALVFGEISIVSFGAGIFEMNWSRSVIRPVVAHLMTRPDAAETPIKPLSLRLKMLLSFGGAVVFTVVLVLFWTYLQYGNLRQDFALTQARRETVTVVEELRQHPGAIRRRLSGIKPITGSRYLYVPPSGPAPSLLSPTSLRDIRANDEGTITLAEHDLAGVYRWISPTGPDLGSLLVLLPIGASARVTLNSHVLIFFFLTVLVVALGGVMLTSADLTAPLVRLEQQATAMAHGRLDLPVILGGELDEIGRLTTAFDKMRVALREKIETIEQLNVGLEHKVRARTAELEASNSELVAAIQALKETQQQLITSEKLASVGQLVAGIAHEINNPINAVVNTVVPLSETVEELLERIDNKEELRETQEELETMLRVIRSGTQRTQRIVQALRNYSRQDSEKRSPMDLHADIEETLSLLQHNLRAIEVVRDFKSRGEIVAYRGQLNQALMNLISNAAGALQGQAGARITVGTLDRQGQVEIRVEDNGPGIPPGVLDRIFDPFFTTKEVGQGTGLGLSITYQIVERHGGQISVSSDEQGTTFTLVIPQNPDLPSS